MKAPYVPWSSLRSLCPQVSQEFPEVPKFPEGSLGSLEFPEVPTQSSEAFFFSLSRAVGLIHAPFSGLH